VYIILHLLGDPLDTIHHDPSLYLRKILEAITSKITVHTLLRPAKYLKDILNVNWYFYKTDHYNISNEKTDQIMALPNIEEDYLRDKWRKNLEN